MYPFQSKEPSSIYDDDELIRIRGCLSRLLTIGAVEEVDDEKEQFLSRVFTVPKSDGTNRLILNVKKLNDFIVNEHFKMEDYRSVCNLLARGMYMATIDLKDAYHLLPIHKDYQKYLRFRVDGKLYQYTALAFGLSTAPRVFTKLLKPVVTYLRECGVILVIYLDDILLISRTYVECLQDVKLTTTLLESLGFVINIKRSMFSPSLRVKYLGFVFDSDSMTMELPDKKRSSIKNLCQIFSQEKEFKVKQLAQFVGTLVAASLAVHMGMLYTRNLEIDKVRALRLCEGDYEGNVRLSDDSRNDIRWWSNVIQYTKQDLRVDKHDLVIETDASLSGWGGHVNGREINGHWTLRQQHLHINLLEMLALENVLRSCTATFVNKTLLVRMDNQVAIAYVNKLGGCRSKTLHMISMRIFAWAEKHNVRLRASYIPSALNYIADRASRESISDLDWQLNVERFKFICKNLKIKPAIDLFASHLSTQCSVFVSWQPDPRAAYVDAFTISWSGQAFYAFPPFCLVTRVLRKIRSDQATGLVVVPWWPSQPWFPLFKILAVSKILILGASDSLLKSHFVDRPHPLARNLQLGAAILSGKVT